MVSDDQSWESTVAMLASYDGDDIGPFGALNAHEITVALPARPAALLPEVAMTTW